ncbi:NAD(P)/FAD-dependent oxidoreductase [Trueperella pecoris]|uniref:Geranylgeranyl reductase family protein n=1 Tax=Trueperella pecoris TaxID=2733571 RepID=A0A7M1QW02_9ACTO|nr:geranylgeranyl reductase family protein [Trueperella pecoris]QOQ39302.1 geranylgeranyl reductase family protein [Trueperella pecoris]QOR46056.1 geranylgeranyl reductase family protein [Trueperella pecoris]QTG75889.1 geranylgeranyl reductase family protein [Trueperella pecoris]
MTGHADVIVVGAGPGGAATAHYLAQNGVDVLVLEKSTFPREKICGDGLTPRAVGELIRMGISLPEEEGWVRNYGVRAYGAGHMIEVPWPELASMPSWGSANRRVNFDELLIKRAVASGARLREGITVTGPIVHEKSGRVVGVRARNADRSQEMTFSARFVVDAGGVAARLATAAGREKNMSRPMGVAYRTYFESPLASTDMMESWLELWAGKPGQSEQLPGYAWAFAVGEGLINVGLGSLSSTAKPSGVDHRKVFSQWLANTPVEWQMNPDTQRGPIRGAALPMGFNRKPHYAAGLALVGDAGGMVSPFNGEGIGPALVSGRLVADAIAQALAHAKLGQQDRVMREYPRQITAELGGYYTLGRIFAALIERPEIMHLCVKYGLPRPTLMTLVMKLLSDSYDRHDGDWMDRLITALTKVVPQA